MAKPQRKQKQLTMKYTLIAAILFASFTTLAQDATHKMESRAKELIAVLSKSDKEAYRKYIKANYTDALINKKMKMNIQGGDAIAAKSDDSDAVQDKVNMYTRFHEDLGEAKITSMKQTGEKLTVEAEGSTGANLSFVLTFQKEEPYLIDGFSVQMLIGR
jgi:hypothetical protein